MDLVERYPESFPWRTATVALGAVALLELFALVAIGAVHLASHARTPAAAKQRPAVQHHATMRPPVVKVHRAALPKPHPLRSRAHVGVLVLNGNGVQGAAAGEASHLQGLGYRIAGTQNAQRHDYARSMVLYVPGFVKEARRLARDTSIRMVSPVDGLRPAMLKGSKLVVLLGS